MIYAYKKKNGNGSFVDIKGERYAVRTASKLYSDTRPCWQAFSSRSAALAHWGLVPYVDESESYERE